MITTVGIIGIIFGVIFAEIAFILVMKQVKNHYGASKIDFSTVFLFKSGIFAIMIPLMYQLFTTIDKFGFDKLLDIITKYGGMTLISLLGLALIAGLYYLNYRIVKVI